MKRWSNYGEIDNPKIDAFLAEIWEVCQRHGLAISHEDGNGSFDVVAIEEMYREWLMQAHDQTTKGPKT